MEKLKRKSKIQPRATLRSNAEILKAKLQEEEERLATQERLLAEEEDSDITIEAQIKAGVGIVNIRIAELRIKLQKMQRAKDKLDARMEQAKTEFAALAAIIKLEKPLVPKLLKRGGYPVGERKIDQKPATSKKASAKKAIVITPAIWSQFKELVMAGDLDAANRLIGKK